MSPQGKPSFSVLVAAYNAESTVRDTLDSLIAQTEPSWQACVVDDGSTDNTYEILLEYARTDPRFVVLRQSNAGAGAARNAAARVAVADYLCVLDADDAYKPTYLERQKAFMHGHPGFDIYSCNADAVLESGETQPYAPERFPRKVCSLGIEDQVRMNRIFVAAVIKTATFWGVGGFREGILAEDYDLWLRLLIQGGTHIHNPESLVLYRVRSDSVSANVDAMLHGMLDVYDHLAAADTCGPRLNRTIRGSIRETHRELGRLQAAVDRGVFETRLFRGDYRDLRRLYWSSRRVSSSPFKYCVGLAIALVSPRLLAMVLRSPGPEAGGEAR